MKRSLEGPVNVSRRVELFAESYIHVIKESIVCICVHSTLLRMHTRIFKYVYILKRERGMSDERCMISEFLPVVDTYVRRGWIERRRQYSAVRRGDCLMVNVQSSQPKPAEWLHECVQCVHGM